MTITVARTPLYEPLGYEASRRGPAFYYFRIDGRVRRFYAWELHSLGFLLELLPDAEHWRAAFPGERRTRIDMGHVAAHFTRLCRERGIYTPSEHMAESLVIAPDKAP